MTDDPRSFYAESMKDTLLKELRNYEDKWIALSEPHEDKIVASGIDASEARREAARKGYKDVILFRVMPFRGGYVPHA